MSWNRFCLVIVIWVVPAVSGFADEKQSATKKPAKVDQAALEKQLALEKQFAAKLSGAALLGTYSVAGKDEDKPPKSERYELESVTKLRDNYWVFLARVKYGKTDIKLPITLKVLWAGDTPVITLTNFSIPGLGTFTARVMFYGDRYAGTWQHGKTGGHMWGNIEKPKASADAEKSIRR